MANTMMTVRDTVPTDLLRRLATQTAHARNLTATVNQMEVDLAEAKRKLRITLEIDIPETMREAGVQQLTLEDGTRISIKDEIYIGADGKGFATFPVEQRMAAFQWLRDHGLEGVIKHAIIAEFSKNEDALAGALIQYCEEQKIAHADRETINPQTLKALIKEQLEKQVDVPFDVFGVTAVSLAVIK